MENYHTVEEEWLVSYCAGGLSSAKRFLLDCQTAINGAFARRVAEIESVGGVMLETAKGESLSDDFMPGLWSKIDTADKTQKAEGALTASVKKRPENWVPSPLSIWLEESKKSLDWINMGFGMARMPLFKDGNEKLYLLKSKPGMKMPKHSHHGQEWALILQGGYHVGDQGFVLGDLHREDQTCTHQPIIDDHGEACITLVASEGGIKFSNPALNLLKPVLGV